MKKTGKQICVAIAAFLLSLAPLTTSWAANTKTTVAQVTETVSLTNDVDYIVTSSTPFGAAGVVDITNVEHAVLILDAVKPSAAVKLLADHVKINGEKAVSGSNCQVKLYNRGCIIMPYGKDFKPLTVYSEPNFGGESCNDFGLENSGGFMNTLSTAKLNNRIRSFKLKRGYMVTFANRNGGRGYSRCFIAADKDLEMKELPGVLDRSISSYRIFKWYDTGKPGLANDTRPEPVAALNVTSCYSFGLGEDRGMDCECVPHHIYEDWPSASACGSVTFSPHMKTNNEPGNSADDHPQTVKQILDNWENLMRTGMRLCSPSSHDGSLGHLREFLDSIDARGWRCDILDLHCYWPEGSFGSIKGWVDKYHRPVWISEWVWGASWNSNGAFASGVTETQNRDAVKRICDNLNSWDYVERYYYWNSERDPSRIYRDGRLTVTGEMYAKLNSGVGYNGKYDFAPKVPAQKDPANLSISFDKLTMESTLKWYDYNGDMNVSMTLQRKRGTDNWIDLADIEKKDQASYYTYVDKESMTGDQYRVVIVDANRKERMTKTIIAVSNEMDVGDPITMTDGTVKYLGGNLFANGDFDYGFAGWTDGEGKALSAPYFQVVPVGGTDGGSYLQAYGNGTGGNAATYDQALITTFDVTPGSDYYYSATFCNGSIQQLLLFGSDGKVVASANMVANNATWATMSKTFNTGDYDKVMLRFRQLACKAQSDKLLLSKLFNTREEALADGVEKMRLQVPLFQQFNQLNAALNADVAAQVAAVTGSDAKALSEIKHILSNALQAYRSLQRIDSLSQVGRTIAAFGLYGSQDVKAAVDNAAKAGTVSSIFEAEEALAAAIAAYMPTTAKSGLVKEPKFSSDKGWTTKCGTFTGGDQKTNKDGSITFWNAWWSDVSASEGEKKTLEVKQDIKNLTHGFYVLECKAMTEHYCISDQHAYITSGSETATSPVLSADYFDLPSVAKTDVWQTLTTTPVYVEQGGTLTIGFKSSKKGAVDNAWHKVGDTKSTGDKREGWWGATDFVLRYYPSYKIQATPGQWGAVCLPYATKPTDGLHYYNIIGITSDYTKLCLEEVSESEPGMPFIYRSDDASALFSGFGASTTFVKNGSGNTYGTFGNSTCPKNWYLLENGVWTRQTAAKAVTPYTVYLKSAVGLSVISDWTGETMPITGAAEEIGDGISPVVLSQPRALDGLYTLDGRMAGSGSQLRSGLYIRVQDGQAKKVMVK